jgi:hypothetical protein
MAITLSLLWPAVDRARKRSETVPHRPVLTAAAGQFYFLARCLS